MGTEMQLQKQQYSAPLAAARLGSHLCSSMRSSSGGLDSCVGDEQVTSVTVLSAATSAGDTARQAAAAGSNTGLALASRCSALQLDAVGMLAGKQRLTDAASVGGAGGQAGREALRLLVDLLLRQRSGRAYAVAQLDELDGSPAALRLQLEVRIAAACHNLE
jgi:hypothetical protein